MTLNLLFAAALLFPAVADAVDDHGEAYRNAVGSVVWITNYDQNWEPSYGTGVVVEGGDILTANHVISSGPSVVTFAEYDEDGEIIADSAHYMADKGKLLQCKVAARDDGRDMALLRLIAPRPEVRPIRLATKGVSPGQSVFTIGNDGHPGSLYRFAAGHVRQISPRETPSDGHLTPVKLVRMTIPLNGGDSGGPVIRGGELVGMSVSDNAGSNQISNAVDVAEIRAFLEKAREKK